MNPGNDSPGQSAITFLAIVGAASLPVLFGLAAVGATAELTEDMTGLGSTYLQIIAGLGTAGLTLALLYGIRCLAQDKDIR